MCLGVPGRLVEIWDEPSGARMAHVEFPSRSDGTGPVSVDTQRLCLAYLPDLLVGEYTIAHAGFALTRIDEESAQITIATMTDYGVFEVPS